MEPEIKNRDKSEAAESENPDAETIQLKFTDNNNTEYVVLPIRQENILEKIDTAEWNRIFSASKEFFRRLMNGDLEIINE